MDADIGDQIVVDDVMSFLKKYEFKIDEQKSTDEKLVIRLPFVTEEEVDNFHQEFSESTCTRWIIYNDYSKRTKCYHRVWICHLSSFKKVVSSKKNAECSAKLDIKIKKLTHDSAAKDIFLRQDPPLRTVVSISLKHTHPINSAMANKRQKATISLKHTHPINLTMAKKRQKVSPKCLSIPCKIKLEDSCIEISDESENSTLVNAKACILESERVKENQNVLQEFARLSNLVKQDSLPKEISSHLLQILKNIKTKEDFLKLSFSQSVSRNKNATVQPTIISFRRKELTRRSKIVSVRYASKLLEKKFDIEDILKKAK